jgi:uncharacterized delta-60 repeat protein
MRSVIQCIFRLSVLLICQSAEHVFAASGDLDTTFGTGGVVITDVPAVQSTGFGLQSEAKAVALDSNGKIVTAGYSGSSNSNFALARYHTDGTLDASFGTGGVVTTDIGTILSVNPGADDQANAVALQSDGKIIAAGFSSIYGSSFSLARYNHDGTLDGSFGTGGVVITNLGLTLSMAETVDTAYGVAVQPDNKIVVAGKSSNRFGLVRYTADGTLDSSFGTNGVVVTAVGAFSGIFGVALQPDGNIVVAGLTAGASTDFAVARYTTTGSLDPSFGSGGIVITNVGDTAHILTTSDQANAITIQADGKIVIGGYSYIFFPNYRFSLARYNTDGSLDSSFGTNGVILTDIGTVLSQGASHDSIYGIGLGRNGRIIAAGKSVAGSTTYVALACYTDTGALDSSFGTGGVVRTNIGIPLSTDATISQAFGVAIRTNQTFVYEKIVVAGSSDAAGLLTFALARYDGQPVPFIPTKAVCTSCGTFLIGTRGCKKALVYNRDGTCVEREYGSFRIPASPLSDPAKVICTSCGSFLIGKRGCKKVLVYNRGGSCVERPYGSFTLPKTSIYSYPISCTELAQTTTVCDCPVPLDPISCTELAQTTTVCDCLILS